MKRKPIRIDWDALERAFSSPQREDASYLDRITGHVVLEGEGEGEDLDDNEAAFEQVRAVNVVAAPVEDPTRLAIRPPGTARKVGWLTAFLTRAEGEHPPEVVAELNEAMQAEDPAPILKEILHAHPEVRDGWWLYRAERIQEMIDAWLADHGVESTAPPPWSP